MFIRLREDVKQITNVVLQRSFSCQWQYVMVFRINHCFNNQSFLRNEKMEYKLDTSNDKYIKVTASGIITKSSLVAAISELMNHPEYIQKHSLWDFFESSIGLTIGDLKEVAGVLRLYKPEGKSFANKSAIVVPGQMHKAMVDLFITMTKLLPFEYKAFNDLEDAKAFLESE